MTAALARPADPRVSVPSARLGTLLADPRDLFTFPEGLVGLPAARDWALVRGARDGFFWLQSRDEPALALVLMDPFRAFPDFEVELAEGDLAVLDADASSDVVVLSVVTLPARAGDPCTTNLQAPVALCVTTGRARQVVRPESPHGTRCELKP